MRGALLALALSAVLSAFGASGCARRGPRAASRPAVVALVGDQPVEYAAYAAYVKSATREEPKTVSPQVASSLLDQYLDELLLERAVDAATGPADKDKSPVERRREFLNRRVGADALPEADLRAAYDAHPDRYRKPARIRVSQILTPTKEKAEAAVKKLNEGTAWVDVSRQLSAAPNAASGGSLGLLSRSDLPRDFEKAIWGLPVGKVSAILATPHGFHLFRLEDRLEERTISFEEALPALRLEVAEERSLAVVAEVLAAARKAYPVQVIEDHLPFPYVGSMPHLAGGRR